MQTKKYKLYFLIGIARSGKSSIAKRYINHEIDFTDTGEVVAPNFMNPEPRMVVCADEWRLALGHRYNSYVEPIIRGHIRIAVRALLRNHNVLVDETNTNKNSILEWLEEDIDAIPVFVDTPVEVCKKRAIDSGQTDLIPVLDRMSINLINTFGKELDILGTVNKLRDEARIRHSFQRIVV